MKTDMELRQEISHAEKVVRHLRRQLRERKRKANGEPKRKRGMGVRIGDRDEALKAARGYTDPSTYVRRDGSEKLAGQDWKQRTQELWDREKGRCEFVCGVLWAHDGTEAVDRCVAVGTDPHHVIARSLHRDDRLTNLMLLCRDHHREIDPRKIRSGKVGA